MSSRGLKYDSSAFSVRLLVPLPFLLVVHSLSIGRAGLGLVLPPLSGSHNKDWNIPNTFLFVSMMLDI